MAGTPLYMAPEVVEESYGAEADIWSCGVVLYTSCRGAPHSLEVGALPTCQRHGVLQA